MKAAREDSARPASAARSLCLSALLLALLLSVFAVQTFWSWRTLRPERGDAVVVLDYTGRARVYPMTHVDAIPAPRPEYRLSGKLSTFSGEGWDVARGACSEEAEGGRCSITLGMPPQPVWSTEEVFDGVRGILDSKQPFTGVVDSGFSCALASVRINQDHVITGFKPHIETFPAAGGEDSAGNGTEGGESTFMLVHHFDIFLCDEGVETALDFSLDDTPTCATNLFMASPFLKRNIGDKPHCHQFSVVWDRDAKAFDFDAGLGILIGPSTSQAKVIVLQAHYLLPKWSLGPGNPLSLREWDSSKFELNLQRVNVWAGDKGSEGPTITTVQDGHPVQPMALLAFNDFGLNYHKGQRHVYHSYRVPGSVISKYYIPGDAEEFGEIQPVAVHLHAHWRTKAMWTEHRRHGKKIGEYGRIDAYESDGADQTFFMLPEEDRHRPFVPATDSLSFHCIVDTLDATDDVIYGISYETEMCAFLFAYTNHNPVGESSNFPKGNAVYVQTRPGLSTKLFH